MVSDSNVIKFISAKVFIYALFLIPHLSLKLSLLLRINLSNSIGIQTLETH